MLGSKFLCVTFAYLLATLWRRNSPSKERHTLFGGLQFDGVQPWNTYLTMLSLKVFMGALSYSLCWKDGRTRGPLRRRLVILQEDNAEPHTEGIYHTWLTEAFAARHWCIELQAPQGTTNPSYKPLWCMVLTLFLVSLQVLIAMFLTLACSRQCRIDIHAPSVL